MWLRGLSHYCRFYIIDEWIDARSNDFFSFGTQNAEISGRIVSGVESTLILLRMATGIIPDLSICSKKSGGCLEEKSGGKKATKFSPSLNVNYSSSPSFSSAGELFF